MCTLHPSPVEGTVCCVYAPELSVVSILFLYVFALGMDPGARQL